MNINKDKQNGNLVIVDGKPRYMNRGPGPSMKQLYIPINNFIANTRAKKTR